MHILVPRLADASNVNAQNLNAKAMLQRFNGTQSTWTMLCCEEPQSEVASNSRVRIRRLTAGRLWTWHMAAAYQDSFDAIFYPGIEWFDDAALALRSICRRRQPIIATFEGVAADAEWETLIARRLGATIPVQPVSTTVRRRITRLYHRAHHIIAISPHLGKIAETLFGPKVSVIPLGFDEHTFHARGRTTSITPRVICAAGVRSHKRPEAFVALARRFPHAQFIWYGEGEKRPGLAEEARRSCPNLSFPGVVSQTELATRMREADIFVLPSLSEGVPKVTQEAAASGLAQIVFAHYRTPTVVHGKNGAVASSDEEMALALDRFLSHRAEREAYGQAGIEMAKGWTWSALAPVWEARILALVQNASKHPRPRRE